MSTMTLDEYQGTVDSHPKKICTLVPYNYLAFPTRFVQKDKEKFLFISSYLKNNKIKMEMQEEWKGKIPKKKWRDDDGLLYFFSLIKYIFLLLPPSFLLSQFLILNETICQKNMPRLIKIIHFIPISFIIINSRKFLFFSYVCSFIHAFRLLLLYHALNRANAEKT